MSQTNGRWEATQPFTDAFIFVSAMDAVATSGTMAYTRNAAGDFSLNAGASQTCVITVSLESLMNRLGTSFLDSDALEQFGGANSPFNSQLRPPITNATNPIAGGAPTTGVMTNRGVKIIDMVVHYFISGAALTLHTVGLTKTVFPVSGTPAALVVSNIIANAANGLATATNANPQSTKVAVASPAFNMSDLSIVQVELDATTQVGGAYRFYGVTFHVNYNWA